jgi:excisionase family DNA binding protein
MTVTRTTWLSSSTAVLRIPTAGASSPNAPQPERPDVQPFMTIKDVADACRLSESAVRRAIYDGELQAVKLRSRLRVTCADFDAWITSQRHCGALSRHSGESRRRAPRRAPAGTFRSLAQSAGTEAST